ISEVLGIPLDIPATEQGPGYGAALLAMVACGRYAHVAEVSRAMLRIKETVEPDPELTARYEARYAEFKQIYPACRTLFANLAKGDT
ncbi:MAG: xylulokinase, partial [Blautia massiliensis (ex Durand et al. 2017)]